MIDYIKYDVDISLLGFIEGFVYPMKSEMKEMRFVAALFLLMCCYPFYSYILKNKLVSISFLLLGIVFNYAVKSYNWRVFNELARCVEIFCFFGGISFLI